MNDFQLTLLGGKRGKVGWRREHDDERVEHCDRSSRPEPVRLLDQWGGLRYCADYGRLRYGSWDLFFVGLLCGIWGYCANVYTISRLR